MRFDFFKMQNAFSVRSLLNHLRYLIRGPGSVLPLFVFSDCSLSLTELDYFNDGLF